ncbi:MAG: hypothetical protein ABJG47_17325 [Ekhidna sp.]
MKNLDKGVWIDERQAWIVYQNRNHVSLKAVGSEVETYHLHGGSGSSTPYGPQEAISETTLNRRKEQQLKNYYHLVIEELLPAKRLYISGPAEAKIALEKEIAQRKNLPLKSVVVEPADSMTKNQFKAKVKDFFEKNHGYDDVMD